MKRLTLQEEIAAVLEEETDASWNKAVGLAFGIMRKITLVTKRRFPTDCYLPEARARAQAIEPKHIHIEGRRWFQRGPGNTYHSVRIWIDETQVAHLPYQYGYGDGFLQTALDWLKANGHVPQNAEYGTRYLREELGGTYSVHDVDRKRDL